MNGENVIAGTSYAAQAWEIDWFLINAVREIDSHCRRLRNGIEFGLCNLKPQFEADLKEGLVARPHRTVKEEDALSWLLIQRLNAARQIARPWVCYPGSKKSCDVVIGRDTEPRGWLEVKLAWKQWFNCTGRIGRSGFYKSYLLGGGGKSHYAQADFSKLRRHAPAGDRIAVLLVGFDSITDPMSNEMSSIIRAAHDDDWQLTHANWPERRDPKYGCRINCWIWHGRARQS